MAIGDSAGLLLKIRADGSQAKSEVRDFASNILGLGDSARTMSTGLLIGTAAVTALASAAVTGAIALFRLAQASSEYGSAINDAMDRTGLGAETLSALRVAAEQSGSSFDAISGSLSKFAVLIGEAKNGSDKAIVTLKNYGITSQNTQTALEQAIVTIARMTDTDKQAAAAKDLFKDRTGAILPVIKSFEGDLPGLIAQLRKLGLVMSDEDARAADAFGDTLDTLSAQAAAAGRVFIGPLMRDITQAMGGISVSLSKNQNTVKEWGESLATTLRGLKNVSSEVYQFMQTRVGAALSMMIFGTWIGLNQALQAAAGPPPPLGVPLPHIIPESDKMQKRTTDPGYGLTDEEKQAIEDRRKAREAAFQKELAARSRENSLFLTAQRSEFAAINRQWEEAFLKGEVTKEQFQEQSLQNVAFYAKNVQNLLLNAFKIDSAGKAGAELQTVRTQYNLALEALNREIAQERVDIEKTLTGVLKQETEEREKKEKESAKAAQEEWDERMRKAEATLKYEVYLTGERLKLEQQRRDLGLDDSGFPKVPRRKPILAPPPEEPLDVRSPLDVFLDGISDYLEGVALVRDANGDLQFSFEQTFASIAEIGMQAFEQLAAGFGQLVANWVLYGDAGAQGLRKMFAQVLAGVAATATAYALMCLAAAALATTVWGAGLLGGTPAQFLKAAALFGAVAAVAAVSGRLVAGNSFSQTAGAATGSGGGSASNDGQQQNDFTTRFGGFGRESSLNGALVSLNRTQAQLEETLDAFKNRISSLPADEVVAMAAESNPATFARANTKYLQDSGARGTTDWRRAAGEYR